MRYLILAFVLLPSALTAQQPAAGSPEAFAGCYELDPDPWPPTVARSAVHAVPRRVVLDTVPATGPLGRGSYRVLPAPGAEPWAHEHAVWSPLPAAPDGFRILWTTGSAGVELRLGGRGEVLRGRAVAFTETAPERAAAEVAARRVEPCPVSTASTTEIAGLEARGTSTPRAPVAEEPVELPPAEPVALPPAEPPVSRAEEIAGYTIGGVMGWLLLHFVGIL